VDLANLGSESEMCVGSRVRLVGVYISFEKNFYWLPFTPPSLVRRIDPSEDQAADRRPPCTRVRPTPSTSARGEHLPELPFLSSTYCAT
jgi:hypothetical protein